MRLFSTVVFASYLLAVLPHPAAALERDIDRPGGDFHGTYVDDATACEKACQANSRCRAWTYVKRDNHCMLKAPAPAPRRDACCTSGLRTVAAPAPAPKPAPAPRRERGSPTIIDYGPCTDPKQRGC
jgi:hypothetical protein